MQALQGEASRILYVNHVGEVSGAEVSMATLISHLNAEECQAVAAVPPDGPLRAMLEQRDVTAHRIAALRLYHTRNPFGLARQAMRVLGHRIQLGGIVERVHPHIIHANSLTAALSATTVGFGMPPVVFHARDLSFPKRAMQWAGSGAHAIIAISESVKKAVVEAAPEAEEKTVVIYNGIDAREFRPTRSRGQVRGLLRLRDDELLVGNVGQLVPWKQQDLFLEVAGLIGSALPQARFIVIGADLFGDHGEYVEQLRARARELGLESRIIWAGYRDDVADLMAAMDVMVHTAEAEPLGRVILEALCVGTPCVAVRANGPAEIIEDTESGMLADAEAQSLADAAITVLTRPRLAAGLVEGGKAAIAEKFTAERMARLTERLYVRVRTQKALAARWPI